MFIFQVRGLRRVMCVDLTSRYVRHNITTSAAAKSRLYFEAPVSFLVFSLVSLSKLQILRIDKLLRLNAPLRTTNKINTPTDLNMKT